MLTTKFAPAIGRFLLWQRSRKHHKGYLALGLKSVKTDFEGIPVHYYAGISEKPPLILLHGFLDSSHTFRRIIPALLKRYSVYAFDIPGFGASKMPHIRELWHIDAIARILSRFCFEYLKLKKTHVLTHSLGGLIAVHMFIYEKSSGRTDSVRYTDMIAPGLLRMPPKMRDEVRRQMYPESESEVRHLLLKMFQNPPVLHSFAMHGLLYQWRNAGFDYLAKNTILLENSVFFSPGQLKKAKIPMRIYWSEDDRILPHGILKSYIKAGFKPLILEGCGHAPQLEAPEVLLKKFKKVKLL